MGDYIRRERANENRASIHGRGEEGGRNKNKRRRKVREIAGSLIRVESASTAVLRPFANGRSDKERSEKKNAARPVESESERK